MNNSSKNLMGDEEEEKLHEFICPISMEIMKNPVIIETGRSFEKKCI